MGSLARVLAWHGLDLPRARALAAEAVTQARAAGDVPVLAACLLAQHNALWAPGTAGERRAVAAEVAALAGQTGDRELLPTGFVALAKRTLDEVLADIG
jgi:sirohydrochlorin ferrochelatase